eukprot:3513604-Amphidinium_carterae.1
MQHLDEAAARNVLKGYGGGLLGKFLQCLVCVPFRTFQQYYTKWTLAVGCRCNLQACVAVLRGQKS